MRSVRFRPVNELASAEPASPTEGVLGLAGVQLSRHASKKRLFARGVDWAPPAQAGPRSMPRCGPADRRQVRAPGTEPRSGLGLTVAIAGAEGEKGRWAKMFALGRTRAGIARARRWL